MNSHMAIKKAEIKKNIQIRLSKGRAPLENSRVCGECIYDRGIVPF